jgi:hypothetical protein
MGPVVQMCAGKAVERLGFCRAHLGEGLLLRTDGHGSRLLRGFPAARTPAGLLRRDVETEAAQVGFGPVCAQCGLVVLGVLLFCCGEQLGSFLDLDTAGGGPLHGVHFGVPGGVDLGGGFCRDVVDIHPQTLPADADTSKQVFGDPHTAGKTAKGNRPEQAICLHGCKRRVLHKSVVLVWHTGLWVPGSGSLRWALRGWIGMSDEEFTHRSNLSRRRRENAPAGTKKRRDLWVTVEEEAALVARAEREKVTVPNLLISSALSEHSDSPTERRAIAAELMSLHNLLARSSNNINQLARQANATSEFPAEAREALKHIRSVAMRIDDAIDGLM